METIVQFGPEGRLVGLLTGPERASGPTLVLPSAGLLPRSGPFRLHVELARRLAAHGVRTFRFDVPGVGESPRIPGWDARRAVLAAIDHLAARHGCQRFVVGGLCSAADVGWKVALEDSRVDGLLMLDGVSFTGPWFHLARIVEVFRRPPRTWPGVVRRLLARRAAGGPKLDMGAYREWPGRAEVRRDFAALVARDVRSLWIFTGGHAACFAHPRQFGWSLGPAARDPRVVMHHWPDCSHTFYLRGHRDRLLGVIDAWMTRDFGSAGARHAA